MTQAIKGEALLPFCAPPPVEQQSSNPDENTEFALLLNGELESQSEPSGNAEPNEETESAPTADPASPSSDPWTWFGFATQVVITSPPPQAAAVPQPAEQATAALTVDLGRHAETSEATTLPPPPREDSTAPPPPGAPDQQKFPSGAPLKPPLAEQSAVKAPEIAPKSDGMFAAQRPAMLLLDRKVEKDFRSKEQGTDGIFSVETPELLEEPTDYTSPIEEIGAESKPGEKKEIDVQLDGAAGELLPEATELPSESVTEPAAVTESKAIATVEQIQQQVQILRSSSLDKLEVVLRPDTDTQLFVQVSKVEGQIQVQIRCDRGDVAFLENHWGKIQQSLSTQGIKVEPLQHSFAGTHFSHSNSQHQQQRHDPSHGAEIDRLGVFLPLNSPKTPTTAVSSARGWQRWA